MSDPYDKTSDAQEFTCRRRELIIEDLRSMVERIIDDAQAKGAFDNLPGQGRPLALDEHNPFAGDRESAYKLLKDNDYTLPWIADRNDILEKIAAFRRKMERVWRQSDWGYRTAPDEAYRAGLRRKWRQRYQELGVEIAALNREIDSLNLRVPVTRLEILKLDLDRELTACGGAPELGAPAQE